MSGHRPIAVLLLVALLGARADAQPPRATELLAEARGLTPDPEHGKILYLKHCTGCHGRHAWGDGPKQIPALAGQREGYVLQQLARFAARVRDSLSMQETLHPADVNRPQAFRDLAAYLSGTARNPRSDHGDGRALAAGQRTYTRECVACHDRSADDRSGEGTDEVPIPVIGGQHYYYVLYRLRSFPALHRNQIEPEALRTVATLSTEDQQGLADYTSRLTTLTAGGH